MQKFIELHRKEIITGAGVLLFMTAGALAMLIMPSENSQPVHESKPQTQNQITVSEPEPTKPIVNETIREIYVYVTGAVKKPGVYKFPEGSRIFEVVEAAGGFTSKADISRDIFRRTAHTHSSEGRTSTHNHECKRKFRNVYAYNSSACGIEIIKIKCEVVRQYRTC